MKRGIDKRRRRRLALLPLLVVASSFGCGSAGPPGPDPQQDTAPVESGPAEQVDPRLEPLRAAVESSPDDVAARRRLARALFDAGFHQEAVEHFQKTVELESSVTGYLDLALAFSSVARLGDAEAAYAKLLELQPDHSIALHNMGNLAFRRGETDRSIELYVQAIKARPDYLVAHYHLGEALRQRGAFRESYKAYERTMGFEPTSPAEMNAQLDALYRMASLDLTMGEYRRAAEYLTELVQIAPDHSSAHYALGQALMHLGRPDEAQREFAIHADVLSRQEPSGPVAAGE